MSSSSQLKFTLRTSTNVRTVHLLGSWDNYTGQLPLSSEGKAGAWKGVFRFQSSMMQPGKRYWYYYIMDGHFVSHDPAQSSTVEPTTGRRLNILDMPKSRASVAVGRPISPSRIVAPQPSKPYASRAVREADYSRSPVDDLAETLEQTVLYSRSSISPTSSLSSSGSSRHRSGNSSPSSLSSLSDDSTGSRCSCRRYGITRKGAKVLLDCGGKRCGYESSSCSSGSDIESDSQSDSEPAPPVKSRSKTVSKSSSSKSSSSSYKTRPSATKTSSSSRGRR